MKTNLVIIEDDIGVSSVFKFIAREMGINSESYFSGEEFLQKEEIGRNSFYIVDKNLPGISGIEVIKMIRDSNKLASIFLISGQSNEDDIFVGLMAGADDFIEKPFNIDHLKIKLLNAKNKARFIRNININEGLKFIKGINTVIINGIPASLSPREFTVLSYMNKFLPNVVPKESIQKAMSDNTTSTDVDLLMFNLRKKLARTSLSIKSIRGLGYRFINKNETNFK